MIALGRKVKVAYVGRLEDGTIFDSTDMHGGEPLEFLVGRQQVIPGFDKAVSEMTIGEKRTVHIPSEMAYGAYSEELVNDVACESFPHWEDLPVGGFVILPLGDSPLRAKVVSIESGTIVFDFNHELAGKDLVFDLELVAVHGEEGSLIEQERVSECACGCDRLKDSIDPLRQHVHAHGTACNCEG